MDNITDRLTSVSTNKNAKSNDHTAMLIDHVTFHHPQKQHLTLIIDWFKKPYVSDFFDDPETGRSIPDLKNYLSGQPFFWTPWLAYYQAIPFAYLMTAEVCGINDEMTEVWEKWREKSGKTYSLDLLIGEEAFLGKGLSHQMIKKFIHHHFPHAKAFLIDPEIRNTRAIHVYQKAGFIAVEEFKPTSGQFAGAKHLLMKMKL